MPTQRTLFLGCALFLGIAAIVLAAIALARVRELSLPLPASLPALNIALPLLAAITLPLFRSLGLKLRNHTSKLLPYLASVPSLAPFALFVLSLVYALPGDLQICAADQKWLKMFENKDVRGIRTIQTQLQCCGYNSMHDRAWPFPSRDTDARTCERTQGYNAACGNMWRQEETVAAVMSVIASFLNWLMMVLISAYGQQEEGQIRLPAWSARPTGLIENGNNQEDQRSEQDSSSRDNPHHHNVWISSTRE